MAELGRAMLALLGFFLAWALLARVTDWFERLVFAPHSRFLDAGRGIIGLALPGLLAVGAVYAFVLTRPDWTAGQLGWPIGSRRALRGLALGLVWGIGMAGVVLALVLAGGARLVAQPPSAETYLGVAVPLGLGLVLAAVLEELLFRAFPLSRLARAIGPLGASTLLSLGFVAAHTGNPDISALGLLNIGLASLVLCAVFFGPGGLAAAIGLHVGWNAALALGADAPVSGLRFALPAIEYYPGPSSLLSGGRFGPEGGLAASVVLAASLAWWVRRASLSKEASS